MKYRTYLFISAMLTAVLCFAIVYWIDRDTIGLAQVNEPYNKHIPLDDVVITDASLSDEMIIRAHSEADRIQVDIVTAVKASKPKLTLVRSNMPVPRVNYAKENLGRTLNEISWQHNNTRISMDLQLGHNEADTRTRFQSGLDGISMGEFFNVPGIGYTAVLVKNVDFNKAVSNVSLHFVKGRAKVSVYVRNFGRSTEKNEKELMELVRIIEPLVIARADIRDP
jgi:hypothetical protein